MGRQIELLALDVDETIFHSFLKSEFEVAIFRDYGKTIENLWVEQFDSESRQFFIWNKEFSWTPDYQQTTDRTKFFISNPHTGPIIEFSRTTREDILKGENGRLYWAKFFMAQAEDLTYDVESFSKWYDTVIRWVKRTCDGKRGQAWCMPQAWAFYQSITESPS